MEHLVNKLKNLYLSIDKDSVESILVEYFGVDIKSIYDEGWFLFDELDQVEFLMKIESRFDVLIDDELAEYIISYMKLPEFLSGITSEKRNASIENLGIV